MATWRVLRGPFTLPERLHRCAFEDWETVDCDLAGCLLCGAMHRCDPNTCPLVCTDGRQVCEITGYCVKNAIFASDPFSSAAHCAAAFPRDPRDYCEANELLIVSNGGAASGGLLLANNKKGCKRKRSCAPTPSPYTTKGGGAAIPHRAHADAAAALAVVPQRRSMILNEEQVQEWICDLLCSARARAALETEQTKRRQRLEAHFIKLARRAHSQRRPLNLVAVCTSLAAAMATVRTPELKDPDALSALAARCRNLVVRFLRRFLDAMRAAIPAIKMRGFVVGLLYLMRTGICLCDSVEVLGQVPELARTLPLENQLQPCFRLSTKIITEAENTIKNTLRGQTRGELEALGFTVY